MVSSSHVQSGLQFLEFMSYTSGTLCTSSDDAPRFSEAEGGLDGDNHGPPAPAVIMGPKLEVPTHLCHGTEPEGSIEGLWQCQKIKSPRATCCGQDRYPGMTRRNLSIPEGQSSQPVTQEPSFKLGLTPQRWAKKNICSSFQAKVPTLPALWALNSPSLFDTGIPMGEVILGGTSVEQREKGGTAYLTQTRSAVGHQTLKPTSADWAKLASFTPPTSRSQPLVQRLRLSAKP